MKGYPDAPRCGFIALAVKVVEQYGNLSISAACFKCKLLSSSTPLQAAVAGVQKVS
jgi:glutaredoxin-related protein